MTQLAQPDTQLAVQSIQPLPARVIEIELSQPLPTLFATDKQTQRTYTRALCLIRLHTRPLGMLEIQLRQPGIQPQEYAQLIWSCLQKRINRHLQDDGLPALTTLDSEGIYLADVPKCIQEREAFLTQAPFVSIIVPTRDRPERISACVDSLLQLQYPDYEILIVDNAPSTTATRDIITQNYAHASRVRYICEDRPGTSQARNRGMMEARGEILAYTDDDVVVDRYWLAEIVHSFHKDDKVACVTGLIFPLELNSASQLWAENAHWLMSEEGIGDPFSHHVYDRKTRHLHLYRVTAFGCGANMAIRTKFLRSIGGYDVALGPGTPAKGGLDVEVFLQVIMHGYTLIFEPGALVRHFHRNSYAALQKQTYANGVSFTAYLTKMVVHYPILLLDLVTKVPYDLTIILLKFIFTSKKSAEPDQKNAQHIQLKSSKKSTHYPRDLNIIQLKGLLYGPFAYFRSRRATRHLRTPILPDTKQPIVPTDMQSASSVD